MIACISFVLVNRAVFHTCASVDTQISKHCFNGTKDCSPLTSCAAPTGALEIKPASKGMTSQVAQPYTCGT